MSYSYDFHFSGPVTDDLGASLARHFHGAKLTATASPNFTANKVTVSGGNAIEGGDYNAEMGRAKLAAFGAFASHLSAGATTLRIWSSTTIAEVRDDGQTIAVYL